MRGTGPTVSICIPSYCGAAFLPATIESVLRQSYTDFELWVIDDASSDETADVVRRYTDERVRLIVNERNLGPAGNWNRCHQVSVGKYFKLLPQDDLLEPDALAEQVRVLEEDRDHEIAVVFGSRTVIDHRGRGLLRRGLPRGRPGRIDGRELVRLCVRAGSNLIGEPGNGLVRMSLVRQLGGYDTQYPYLVDLDYWFRALAYGDAYYTGKRTSWFRVSKSSWSVALQRVQLADFKGFVGKYAGAAAYGITPADVIVGIARARLNTLGRALIYRSLIRAR